MRTPKPGWTCNKCGRNHASNSIVIKAHPEKFEGVTEWRMCPTCCESRQHTFHEHPKPAPYSRYLGTKEGRPGKANIYASHGYQIRTRPPRIDESDI